jgi:hypothetical protein
MRRARAAVLSTDAFVTNKRGFPVLPKRHQELLACLLQHGVQLLLRGEARHSPEGGAGGLADGAPAEGAPAAAAAAEGAEAPPGAHPLQLYWEYLAYIFGKLEEVSEQERLESGYRDYLQAPLQPLMDNLESQTYETFEKDDTKYSTYEEAVFRALQDLPAPTPAEASGPGGGAAVVMVVGAGRGPLVRASLRAGERAARPLRVYAVEKNPNAVVHLHALHAAQRWGARVTIVSHDMRTWQAPELAHILVSELLGSFGDNELSPECLDGAQRFLAPGGVSVPQAYTSFLAPVTAAKLHADVRGYADLAHLETPYVVKLHRVAPLAAALPVFTFEHPNPAQPIDNSRCGGAPAAQRARMRRARIVCVLRARARCCVACQGAVAALRARPGCACGAAARLRGLLRRVPVQGRAPEHLPAHAHAQHVLLVPHLLPAARAGACARRRSRRGEHLALRQQRQGVVRVVHHGASGAHGARRGTRRGTRRVQPALALTRSSRARRCRRCTTRTGAATLWDCEEMRSQPANNI